MLSLPMSKSPLTLSRSHRTDQWQIGFLADFLRRSILYIITSLEKIRDTAVGIGTEALATHAGAAVTRDDMNIR